MGIAGGFLDGFARHFRFTVGDVLCHGAVEQHHLLGDQGNVMTQIAEAVVLHRNAVQQDFSAAVIIEAWNETHQAGFAGTGLAHQRDGLPGLGDKAHVIQCLAVTAVGEAHVAKLDTSLHRLSLVAAVIHFRCFIQQLEDTRRCRDPALDDGIDLGELANGFG